jgi:biopolymer transport protein ExbD
VTGARFITPSGPFDAPMSHFRVALLTVATALSVVVLVLLLTVSPTQHAIKIDVWEPPPGWPDTVVNRPVHVLAIRADGSMIFNGAPVANLLALRQLVDVDQQVVPVPMLRIEPNANLRYADFLEVLAVIKHANVYNFCIDFDVDRRRGELKCAPPPALK